MTKMKQRLMARTTLTVMVTNTVPAVFALEGAAAEEIAVTGVVKDAPDKADGTPTYGITDESTMTGRAPPIGYYLEGDYGAYVGQRVTMYGTPSYPGEVRVLNVTRIEQ